MSGDREINWDAGPLRVCLDIGSDGVVRLRSILPSNTDNEPSQSKFFSDASLPLTEFRLAGDGNDSFKTSKSLVGSRASIRIRYLRHRFSSSPNATSLEIVSEDEEAKLTVTVALTVYSGVPVLRSETVVTNNSDSELVISQSSSMVLGNLTRATKDWSRDYTLSKATNSWFREAQWHNRSLLDAGLGDIGLFDTGDPHQASYAAYSLSNRGGFSTGSHLPMGMLKRNDGKETWLWQMEHNGSWRWEVGDFQDSLYLAMTGPTGVDHGCWVHLPPGEFFKTAPAAVCHVQDSQDAAFAALTEYRRRIRREHTDNETLPIIFNDFMNCLMGDPTEDKIAALLDPVVRAGAEYYVIDAGWYSDEQGWWDSIGAWEPSTERFPSGLMTTVDLIRSKGLRPGLWLEPEVVGRRSPIAQAMPPEAFFQDHGRRLIERNRYHLDFRHPSVIERMNHVIDSLISHYGVEYFKFDYNIEVTLGTDAGGTSPGTGHLGHCRAYLDWIRGLLDRHPSLVIENCSSGGQRMDYAMLAVHPLQSTSDQQDPVLYAAIAAAIPTAVVPEQAASWAYPQPGWSDELNAFTVVNSLLGRVHLSGRLDQLDARQMALISQGMRVFKEIRPRLRQATPFWPLGLPHWCDDWLALGMTFAGGAYLAVWRRGGSTTCHLPMADRGWNGSRTSIELLYPAEFEAETHWKEDGSTLSVIFPAVISARLFCISSP